MAPPVTTKDPLIAQGDRLVAVADLGPAFVREVETERHGTLAVGIANGEPFAVSNVCRHQFAKLGRGRVEGEGRLECPWHRALYDVRTGAMVRGPQGKVWGFPAYSKSVRAVGNAAFKLDSHPVIVRDGVIFLV